MGYQWTREKRVPTSSGRWLLVIVLQVLCITHGVDGVGCPRRVAAGHRTIIRNNFDLGYCYEFVSRDYKTWIGARDDCLEQGHGTLAVLDTEVKWNAVMDMFKNEDLSGGVWFGLHSNDQGGHNWTWVSGASLGEWDVWKNHNHVRSQCCAHIETTAGGSSWYWDDDKNSRRRKFMCQYDLDECFYGNGGCLDLCKNTNGSYECATKKCRKGYVYSSADKKCNDKNECNTENGGCAGTCRNTLGGYRCDSKGCAEGYRRVRTACVDDNECSRSNGGCAGKCRNLVGSYKCDGRGCKSGYEKAGTGCILIATSAPTTTTTTTTSTTPTTTQETTTSQVTTITQTMSAGSESPTQTAVTMSSSTENTAMTTVVPNTEDTTTINDVSTQLGDVTTETVSSATGSSGETTPQQSGSPGVTTKTVSTATGSSGETTPQQSVSPGEQSTPSAANETAASSGATPENSIGPSSSALVATTTKPDGDGTTPDTHNLPEEPHGYRHLAIHQEEILEEQPLGLHFIFAGYGTGVVLIFVILIIASVLYRRLSQVSRLLQDSTHL